MVWAVSLCSNSEICQDLHWVEGSCWSLLLKQGLWVTFGTFSLKTILRRLFIWSTKCLSVQLKPKYQEEFHSTNILSLRFFHRPKLPGNISRHVPYIELNGWLVLNAYQDMCPKNEFCQDLHFKIGWMHMVGWYWIRFCFISWWRGLLSAAACLLCYCCLLVWVYKLALVLLFCAVLVHEIILNCVLICTPPTLLLCRDSTEPSSVDALSSLVM